MNFCIPCPWYCRCSLSPSTAALSLGVCWNNSGVVVKMGLAVCVVVFSCLFFFSVGFSFLLSFKLIVLFEALGTVTALFVSKS